VLQAISVAVLEAIAFGQVQFDTEFFAKPGEVHFGGFYKKTDELDLRFTTVPPEYPYPPAAPGTPQFLTLPETYAIFTGFDQYLVTYGPPDARGNTEGWGLFGRAGIADGATGNPNWGAWHASLGIGGNSPLKSRRGKGDRFGIAWALGTCIGRSLACHLYTPYGVRSTNRRCPTQG
jgi:porin